MAQTNSMVFQGGVLTVMTGGRVTRPDYTVQSIQMAVLALNPAFYECGDQVPSGINDELGLLRKLAARTWLMLGVAAAAAAVFAARAGLPRK